MSLADVLLLLFGFDCLCLAAVWWLSLRAPLREDLAEADQRLDGVPTW
jgi:hypothetical protein